MEAVADLNVAVTDTNQTADITAEEVDNMEVDLYVDVSILPPRDLSFTEGYAPPCSPPPGVLPLEAEDAILECWVPSELEATLSRVQASFAPLEALVDGPLLCPFDEADRAILGPKAARNHRAKAADIFPVGDWISATGTPLGVEVNGSVRGGEKCLRPWVDNFRVSVAQISCTTCRAMEAHRPEGERSFPCLVKAFTDRKGGEVCLFCKVKAQTCTASNFGDEDTVMAPAPRERRPAAGNRARAAEINRLVEEAGARESAVQEVLEMWLATIQELGAGASEHDSEALSDHLTNSITFVSIPVFGYE